MGLGVGDNRLGYCSLEGEKRLGLNKRNIRFQVGVRSRRQLIGLRRRRLKVWFGLKCSSIFLSNLCLHLLLSHHVFIYLSFILTDKSMTG